jgi:hypothetical protein
LTASVSSRYETSLDWPLAGETPAVLRAAAKLTMRVSVGAAKLQLALEPPKIEGVASSEAVSGPALGQEFVAWP